MIRWALFVFLFCGQVLAKDAALWLAIDKSDWPLVIKTLQKNPELLKDRNEYNETVLMMAAVSAEPKKQLQKILDLKPELEAKTDLGVTALSLAVAEGKTKGAELLIKAGANIEILDAEGWNLMATPVRECNIEMLSLLHKHNAKLIQQKNKTKSLVDLARESFQSRCEKWLLKNQ